MIQVLEAEEIGIILIRNFWLVILCYFEKCPIFRVTRSALCEVLRVLLELATEVVLSFVLGEFASASSWSRSSRGSVKAQPSRSRLNALVRS